MTVDVTQADIDNSRAGIRWECPIAIAVGRALGTNEIGEVDVFNHYIEEWFSSDRQVSRWTLPPEASYFVNSFDKGGPSSVQPFQFETVRRD
jgi:hypothetical protein